MYVCSETHHNCHQFLLNFAFSTAPISSCCLSRCSFVRVRPFSTSTSISFPFPGFLRSSNFSPSSLILSKDYGADDFRRSRHAHIAVEGVMPVGNPGLYRTTKTGELPGNLYYSAESVVCIRCGDQYRPKRCLHVIASGLESEVPTSLI